MMRNDDNSVTCDLPDNYVAVIEHFVIVCPEVIHANLYCTIRPDRVFSS